LRDEVFKVWDMVFHTSRGQGRKIPEVTKRERERERERVIRKEEREKPWHLLHDCSIWPLA